MANPHTVGDQTACVGAASPLPLRKRRLSAESAIKVPNPEATKLQKVGGADRALSGMISKPVLIGGEVSSSSVRIIDRGDLKPAMKMLQKVAPAYLEERYEEAKNVKDELETGDVDLSKDGQQFKKLLIEALANQQGDFDNRSALGSRFSRQVRKGTEMHKEYLDFVEKQKKEGMKPNRAL